MTQLRLELRISTLRGWRFIPVNLLGQLPQLYGPGVWDLYPSSNYLYLPVKGVATLVSPVQVNSVCVYNRYPTRHTTLGWTFLCQPCLRRDSIWHFGTPYRNRTYNSWIRSPACVAIARGINTEATARSCVDSFSNVIHTGICCFCIWLRGEELHTL